MKTPAPKPTDEVTCRGQVVRATGDDPSKIGLPFISQHTLRSAFLPSIKTALRPLASRSSAAISTNIQDSFYTSGFCVLFEIGDRLLNLRTGLAAGTNSQHVRQLRQRAVNRVHVLGVIHIATCPANKSVTRLAPPIQAVVAVCKSGPSNR